MTHAKDDKKTYRSLNRDLIRQIEKIVGKEHLLSSKEDLVCYGYGATNLEALPDLVVFPRASSQISEILSSKIVPSTMEFMDNASIQCVEDYLKMGLPRDAGLCS
jgi:hypothetical protein